MEELLITIVPGLLIAITTLFVTVRLSINQFYSQKWWERKWDEYREMVEKRRQMLLEHAREGYE